MPHAALRKPRFSAVVLAVASLAIAAAPLLAAAPSEAPSAGRLSATDAARDLRILRRSLEALHPGLHRRLAPAQFAAEFSRADAEVADGSDVLEMYRLASRIAAAIRCGHTWTNPLNQGPAVQSALADLPALPLRIRVIGNRWLVTASADPRVPAPSELLAIDGRGPGDLTAAFLPYLRADGDSDGKRIDQLEGGAAGGALDRLLPQLFPPGDAGYHVRFRVPGQRPREATVVALRAAHREAALAAAGHPADSEAWRFEIDAGVAVLTLPTFAFWGDAFDWRGFLDRAFERLRAENIRQLVVDLRRNEGGSLDVADALLAQLLAAPLDVPGSRRVSAYERAPYVLVRFLDTWDYGFFDRTGKVRPSGDGRWSFIDPPAARRIVPVARPFGGRVAMLTGPRMSSSGFLVARDFQASGRGVLVGRPTGGSLRGLNGGELAWVTLPASGVAVDIPLVAAYAAGTETATPPPDRGVLPDIEVAIALEAVAEGRDPEMDAARRWLRRGTPPPPGHP